MEEAIAAWEEEGGAPQNHPENARPNLTGTASQIEWAQQIREKVLAEFERVEKVISAAGNAQSDQQQMDTLIVLAILEDKRAEVMARDQAGYFIRDWQDLSDQVRRMIAADSRFEAIKVGRAARRR